MNEIGKDKLLNKLEEKNILTGNDINLLKKLLVDSDEEKKILISQILAKDNTTRSENILLGLINDKSELVRANACDSLYNNISNNVVEELLVKANNDTSLVKYYAILSLGDIVEINTENKQKVIGNLRNLRKNNKDISVNISISKVLYQLGNKAELNILLNYLDDSNYQNRCATLNCISEIISSNNFKKIIPILKEKIKAEDSLAVKESLENIIKIYN